MFSIAARKKLVLLMLVASLMMIAGCESSNDAGMVSSDQAIGSSNGTFAEGFKNAVNRESSVWTRWIMLDGGIYSEKTISEELKAMADAGIQHVEVNNQNFYWTDTNTGAGVDYMDVFYWILKYGKEYGLIIDWSTGDMYPAGFDSDSKYYDKSIGMYMIDYSGIDVGAGLEAENLVAITSRGGGFPGGGGMPAMGMTPQGGMPSGTGGAEGGLPGGQGAQGSGREGMFPQGGMPGGAPQGGMPGGQAAQAGGREGMPSQGGMSGGTGGGGFPPMGGLPGGTGGSASVKNSLSDHEEILSVSAAYINDNGRVVATVLLADALSLVPDGDTHSSTIAIGKGFVTLNDIADGSGAYDNDFESGIVTVTPDDLAGLLSIQDRALVDGTEGAWTIFSFEKVEQSSYLGYIDYMKAAATEAWCNYWDDDILNSGYWANRGLSHEEVVDLFESVSGGFFEDSLESFTMNYTDDFFKAFKEVNGYDFPLNRLCTMIVNGKIAGTVDLKKDSDYKFDAVRDRQLRNDYYNTMTHMYSENHLGIYTTFAKKHGMDTRIQAAYNYTLDEDAALAYVTIPENETLNGQDRLDVYRAYTGAAHVNKANVISSESAANGDGKSYACIWSDLLWHFNRQYAGGINEALFHAVDYVYCGWGTMWPGRSGAGTTAGQCEPMGQRMPYWTLMKDTVSAYIARLQLILQSGVADIDLAIYRYAYDYGLAGDSGREWYADKGLAQSGYTYEFLGDRSIKTIDYDEGVGALFPEGSSYKALLIEQYRKTDDGTLTGVIPVATAQKILEMARKGLKVIVIGDPPDKTAENRDNYIGGELQADLPDIATGEIVGYGDYRIRTIMRELLALDNVMQVKREADVLGALKAFGVESDSAFENPTADLETYHRKESNADYYYFFNSSYTSIQAGKERTFSTASPAHDISTHVLLKGVKGGVPYFLNPWSGEITRIPDYSITDDGRFRVKIDLAADSTTIIGIGTTAWYTDGRGKRLTIAETEADVFTDSNGDLFITADKAGTYATTLSDGSTISSTMSAIPEDIQVAEWSLDITRYEPNADFQAGKAGENNKNVYEIMRTAVGAYDPVDSATGGLKAWKNIADDLNSGIGVYTATVTLPSDYNPETMGYALSFEEVNELFVVRVNGVQVETFEQNYPRKDISPYLAAGENTIEVTVASGLWNSVKYYNTKTSAAGLDAFSQDRTFKDWWSNDGIIGPVTLEGYGRAKIDL